jgi:hypothetical protein
MPFFLSHAVKAKTYRKIMFLENIRKISLRLVVCYWFTAGQTLDSHWLIL